MKESRLNWKLIVRIHQVVIGLLLLTQLFLNGDLKKVSIIMLAIAGFSLLIQGLVFIAKSELYGNKVTKQPHEVLKKLNG